ncbi:MAG TPA: N,N-dimethylformamidase beta subunit family domain-containing protein, partial [Solirubrobacteraceae bacterium]|nr:N,N-dimethylformamidase beta subunit family domain-containing protein [Solirubrobacteraceae bacterium]
MPIARRLILGLVAAAAALALLPATGHAATDPCATPVTNPVACENSKPGTPTSDWEVAGDGDSTIQGFATKMSVNVGQAISFKVDTSASYHLDILRLGYYGGDGARKIAASVPVTARSQPACLTAQATGIVDCGNWGVSATWTVPSTAVSGVYVAHLVRNDTGGDSLIPFVVRDDSSHSAVVLQTSDATWQAYNNYGGNSLYKCTALCPAGNPLAYKAAYAVSYNRPWDGSFATDGGHSYFWYAEYQMVRFLEENGYDTSYVAQADLDQNPALLKNHKVFLSSGHDEYWSGAERSAVESARDAGVNLAFFSGNEVFWKTRWENNRRTLVTYKETHANGKIDPEPTTWTGTWRDPRFSPPA